MVFNRLLLVTCICIVGSLTLYFFYWNRFIAYIIGQVIRILYWNQEASSVWVEIGEHINFLVSKIMSRLATGSIHFSLLAGRFLLKDVRYHSSNQTVKIVISQIQWRYWIRRPTSEEDISSAREDECKYIVTFRCEYS